MSSTCSPLPRQIPQSRQPVIASDHTSPDPSHFQHSDIKRLINRCRGRDPRPARSAPCVQQVEPRQPGVRVKAGADDEEVTPARTCRRRHTAKIGSRWLRETREGGRKIVGNIGFFDPAAGEQAQHHGTSPLQRDPAKYQCRHPDHRLPSWCRVSTNAASCTRAGHLFTGVTRSHRA